MTLARRGSGTIEVRRRRGLRRGVALGVAAVVAAAVAGVDPVGATYPGTTNGRLAMGMDRGGNTDVYSVMPNGDGLRRLTTSPDFDACPAYSADGKSIAYCSGDNSSLSGVIEIWTMKANGHKRRKVTDIGGRMTFPDFAPDGESIALSGLLPGATAEDVFVVGTDGTGLTRLTSAAGHDQFPAWSPDGSKITFISARTGTGQVWVMDSDGANQRQLTFDAPLKGQLPDWSPDGTRIAYSTGDPALGSDLWVMNADGSNQVQLTNDADRQIGAAWSPDGTKIAFLNGLPNRFVNVVNADGTGRYVVVAEGLQFVPAWQPRGDRIR